MRYFFIFTQLNDLVYIVINKTYVGICFQDTLYQTMLVASLTLKKVRQIYTQKSEIANTMSCSKPEPPSNRRLMLVVRFLLSPMEFLQLLSIRTTMCTDQLVCIATPMRHWEASASKESKTGLHTKNIFKKYFLKICLPCNIT